MAAYRGDSSGWVSVLLAARGHGLAMIRGRGDDDDAGGEKVCCAAEGVEPIPLVARGAQRLSAAGPPRGTRVSTANPQKDPGTAVSPDDPDRPVPGLDSAAGGPIRHSAASSPRQRATPAEYQV